MTQLNDESALRAVLADLTAGQPPAPPDRLTSVRRRVVRQRRRRLAGLAAAVAVLAAAAVTIPLGLHAAGPAPQAPQRHYHVSEQPPGPGSKRGLVATARLNGVSYPVLVQRQPGLSGYFLNTGGAGEEGIGDAATPASRTGDPASFIVSGGTAPQVQLGTVRSDVAYVTITYSNGQILTLHPADVLGPTYAPFIVFITPYPAAVVRVTAYSRTSELGYAVPFTAAESVNVTRWLRPNQAALPRPLTRLIGSGSVDGTAWKAKMAIGPWGVCEFIRSSLATTSYCGPYPASGPPQGAVVSPVGGTMFGALGVHIYPGQASATVAYLQITTKDSTTTRVPVVAAGAQRYFAYADGPGNRVVRWAAYSAAGLKLAAGSGEVS